MSGCCSRAALAVPGGKAGAGVYQSIINQFPPHRRYIEPFAGSAAVRRLMRPSPLSLLIELDRDQAARLVAAFAGDSAVTVMNGDALDWLARSVSYHDDLVFADPPYLASSRRSSAPLYACELATPLEHRRLLALLKSLPAMVAIAHYDCPFYRAELPGWRTISFTGFTRSGPRPETLWMNYPEPFALHDYAFLGSDYRERERIKRKAARWTAKLERMPRLERQALLSAIAHLPDQR